MTDNPTIPEGFIQLANGDMRNKKNLRAIDLLRHEFVESVVPSAKALEATMAAHKSAVNSEFEAFLDQSLSEHGVDYRGNASGVTIQSLDGKKRFVVENYAHESATEEVKAAETLIREYLESRDDGGDPDFWRLIQNTFAPSSTGRISVSKLKNLRQQGGHIQDDRWRKAMAIIDQAIYVAGTKRMFRFYQIDEEGNEQQIVLQYSRIPVHGDDE